MVAVIVFVAILFFAISLGIQIAVSKSMLLAFHYNENGVANASKMKVGSIILIALYAYRLFQSLMNVVKTYPANWTSGALSMELSRAFIFVFSILIILSHIMLGVFLLKKMQKLAITSAVTIAAMQLFKAIFIDTLSSVFECYCSLLPTSIVFISLFVVLIGVNGKSALFHRCPKLFRAAPYFVLFGFFETLFIIIENSISGNIGFVIISSIFIFLEFGAYYLIFGSLIPMIQTPEKETEPLSKTKKIIIALTIVLFPILVYLLSSVEKIWLLAASVILVIAIPIAFAMTVDSTRKTKGVAVICTVVSVIALCFIVNFTMNGSSGSNTCGHPACAENGPFPCYGKNNTCPNFTYCYQDMYCDECD